MKKFILVVLTSLIVIFFIPTIEQFTISNSKTNQLVFIDSTHKYENFYISFIHSVNRTPVHEYYRIENKKFVVYKTTFYSYGAGMPDKSEYPNAIIKFNDNGLIEIDNLNRQLNNFTYMVGTYASHTLHNNKESFKLDNYVEPQQPALFEIKKVSIFDILRRR